MLTLVMTVLVLLGGVIFDIGEYYSRSRTFEREGYLMLHSQMKAFDRNLFDRYGILATKALNQRFDYGDSLGEPAILKGKITEVMGYRTQGNLAGDLLGSAEGFQEITQIIQEVSQVNSLKNTINRELQNQRIPDERILTGFLESFVKVGIFFEGSPPSLEGLMEGEIIDIHLKGEFAEIFDSFTGLSSQTGLLNFLSPFLLGEYVVDYLGYSSNLNPRNPFGAEYVLTGISYGPVQRSLVMSELSGLRLVLNTGAYLKSPRHMKQFMTQGGPDPRAQLALLLLAALKTSVMDVSKLYQGGRVPLLKTPAELDQTTFNRGVTYPDYLKIMLITLPEFMILSRTKKVMERFLEVPLAEYYTRVGIRREFSYEFKTFKHFKSQAKTFEASY
ncbi:MAG: hypothetical protein AVO33_05725 [delta proteobacterium ML8_F1]|nr:MAG: hypothetical protein AVO33_05725 [delta proteobacterium ML8_F1]